MSEELTEDQVMDSLMSEILDQEAPQEEMTELPQEEQPMMEEIPQEQPIPQDMPPDTLPQNELVPNKTEELLGQLVQQNQELKEALQPKEPEPELSEEDMALQELAQKLGLTDKLAEIDQLKAQLAEQQQFNEQQQQAQLQQQEMQHQAQQAMTVLDAIQKDFGINEKMLADKVDEAIASGSIPPDRREDPVIWKLMAQNLSMNSQPQHRPDAITSTQSNIATKSPSQLRREGKEVDDMSIVSEILNGR